MKKLVSILMALIMLLGSAAAVAEGSVSTDGSTSMEKVIGALGEYFTEQNKGVNFTYNPTGSGSGIAAVLEGLRHRPFQPRPEGRGERIRTG